MIIFIFFVFSFQFEFITRKFGGKVGAPGKVGRRRRIGKSPVQFFKYFLKSTLYDDPKEVHINSYFINKNITKARINTFMHEKDQKLEMYHIEPAPSQTTYNVLYLKDKFFLCELSQTEFGKVDILEDIYVDFTEYVGVYDCGDSQKCDVWKVPDEGNQVEEDIFYWALVEEGIPMKVVIDEKGKPEFLFIKFSDFSYGKTAFDDETTFKMPIDKSECKSYPAGK